MSLYNMKIHKLLKRETKIISQYIQFNMARDLFKKEKKIVDKFIVFFLYEDSRIKNV